MTATYFSKKIRKKVAVTNFFPAAILVSIGLHAGLWGLSRVLAQPVQYAVHQAPSSIEMVFIEEVPAQPEPALEEIVMAVPDEIELPVEEPKEEEPLRQETQESVGAVSEAVPLEIVNPAPEYPTLARRRGWEGLVTVRVTVERDGAPSSVTVAQSSGYRILDEAALFAIRQWRFQPARRGERAFISTITIPVRFQLVEK